jgi:hypothetical protein
MPVPQELKFDNDWLLVFMDETGHETFAGDHPYFAVGGCAILGDHHAAVNAQWREVRCAINGDPDAPLHAADLKYSDENFAVLSQFFKSPAFARFGVAATNKTNFAVDMHAMAAVMGMLKQHIARIVERLPCSTVALIFESLQRGDPLVRRHFGELGLLEAERPVPTEHCFMPKSAGEPGLGSPISSPAPPEARPVFIIAVVRVSLRTTRPCFTSVHRRARSSSILQKSAARAKTTRLGCKE